MKDMTLDSNTLQLISNVLVFIGVVVAVGTIIYNVQTAKKTQTANFLFESRQDRQYIESLHVLKKYIARVNHFALMYFRQRDTSSPMMRWKNAENFNTYSISMNALQSASVKASKTNE